MNIFRTASPSVLKVTPSKSGKSIFIACLLFSLSPIVAQAEIYKHINKDGTVEYTDTPSIDAKPVILPKLTIWHLDKPLPTPTTTTPNTTSHKPSHKMADYQSLVFVSPQDNSAFYATNGELAVSVKTSPSLQNGDRIEFLVDGQSVLTTSSTHGTLKNLDRGTHQFSAKIIDKSGKALFSGNTITVTIHKPSILLHRK
jgi:hypothetical protein